jgi:hypothetical protein
VTPCVVAIGAGLIPAAFVVVGHRVAATVSGVRKPCRPQPGSLCG